MPFYDVQRADVSMCSWLEQRAIRSASALSSCSGFLAREVRDKMNIRTRVSVIPNGIDLDLFDAEEMADITEKYGLPRNKLTSFFAGRMERRKGIHLCGEIAGPILRDYDVAFVFAGQDLFGYMADTLLFFLRAQRLKGSFTRSANWICRTSGRACEWPAYSCCRAFGRIARTPAWRLWRRAALYSQPVRTDVRVAGLSLHFYKSVVESCRKNKTSHRIRPE